MVCIDWHLRLCAHCADVITGRSIKLTESLLEAAGTANLMVRCIQQSLEGSVVRVWHGECISFTFLPSSFLLFVHKKMASRVKIN